MQKYRADTKRSQADGAIIWSAQWMGGPSLAKIETLAALRAAGRGFTARNRRGETPNGTQ